MYLVPCVFFCSNSVLINQTVAFLEHRFLKMHRLFVVMSHTAPWPLALEPSVNLVARVVFHLNSALFNHCAVFLEHRFLKCTGCSCVAFVPCAMREFSSRLVFILMLHCAVILWGSSNTTFWSDVAHSSVRFVLPDLREFNAPRVFSFILGTRLSFRSFC